MNSRERVMNVLAGKPVDRAAVQYYYSPVGYYEHGEKLNTLYDKYHGDFAPFERHQIPVISKDKYDKNGNYYDINADEWGTTYEFRTYGIMGHASKFPVNTYEDAKNYKFPEMSNDSAGLKNYISDYKKKYFSLMGSSASICERMWAIRGFEQFMMDIYDDSDEINALMDRLAEYFRLQVEALVLAGAEGVSFGDDFGTQESLLFSKDVFRRVIKPRLKHMMEPAVKAGLHIHFHSCGKVLELFDDFKDLGVKSIWPQLPVYDMKELRDALKYYDFSIAIHTDRAVTMTSGSAEEVRELVMLENEIFKPKDGGAWFYVECDTGFPFENIRTLVESVYSL